MGVSRGHRLGRSTWGSSCLRGNLLSQSWAEWWVGRARSVFGAPQDRET